MSVLLSRSLLAASAANQKPAWAARLCAHEWLRVAAETRVPKQQETLSMYYLQREERLTMKRRVKRRVMMVQRRVVMKRRERMMMVQRCEAAPQPGVRNCSNSRNITAINLIKLLLSIIQIYLICLLKKFDCRFDYRITFN